MNYHLGDKQGPIFTNKEQKANIYLVINKTKFQVQPNRRHALHFFCDDYLLL
jgi:hypothetical protein